MTTSKKFTPRTPDGTPPQLRGGPSKSPDVIGMGGFGCVHNPAMKCEAAPAGFSYKDKISKYVRLETSALEEYDNYMKMKTLDPNRKYTLPPPIMCNPREDEKNRRAIDRCQIIKKIMFPKLLVMENGGISLDDLAKGVASGTLDVDMTDVFREFDLAFEAMEYFNERGFLHRDVKVHNILYKATAPEGHKIKIIDFGMSMTRNNYIDSLLQNQNLYFAHPPEIAMTADLYPDLKNLSVDDFVYKYDYNYRSHFLNLIKLTGITDPMEQFRAIVKDFNIFVEFKRKMEKTDLTDDEYIEKIADTLDGYGLGVALRTLAIKCARLINPNIKQKIYELGYKMSHPNLLLRMDLKTAHKKYRQILGLGRAAAAADCKSEYEMVNGKCRKKCAANQTRNATTGRCVRAARAATKKTRQKPCAANQEQNAAGRCVKKCAANQTRNARTGRCVRAPRVAA